MNTSFVVAAVSSRNSSNMQGLNSIAQTLRSEEKYKKDYELHTENEQIKKDK